jgi:hypothetical protein
MRGSGHTAEMPDKDIGMKSLQMLTFFLNLALNPIANQVFVRACYDHYEIIIAIVGIVDEKIYFWCVD